MANCKDYQKYSVLCQQCDYPKSVACCKPTFEEKAGVLADNERLCDACRYEMDCGRIAVRGGPNGPIYSPCTDGDFEYFLDEDEVDRVYAEIMEEEKENAAKEGEV